MHLIIDFFEQRQRALCRVWNNKHYTKCSQVDSHRQKHVVFRMNGLHPTLGEAEENTKQGKPNYVGYVGKIELERIAEERIVDD